MGLETMTEISMDLNLLDNKEIHEIKNIMSNLAFQ